MWYFPEAFLSFFFFLKLHMSKTFVDYLLSGTINNQITATLKWGYSLEKEIQYTIINIQI